MESVQAFSIDTARYALHNQRRRYTRNLYSFHVAKMEVRLVPMAVVPFPAQRPALHTALLLCIASDACEEFERVSMADHGTLAMMASEMLQQDFEEAEVEQAIEALVESGKLVRWRDGLVADWLPDLIRLQQSSDPEDWVEYRTDGGRITRRTADATGWVELDDLRLALLLLYEEEVGTVLRAWGVYRRLRDLRR